jgi:ribulose-bisphosphate carboxylase small chain
MWGLPLFDLEVDQADAVLREVRACREAHPHHYIKLIAYDASRGRQTTALSFIVNRPADEPGFRLVRTEDHDRVVRYGLHPYAADKPAGRRYANGAAP